MEGAPLIALAAAVGNLLQGWDSSAIAGALLYIKPEFHLEDNPTMVGLVVAATLVAAILGTALAGPSSDWLGRRTMLRVSAIFYSLGSLVMMWSPYVYVLLVGRLLTGAGIGLATTIVPILIAESAPTEIRGQLATFPQLTGTSGQFLSYCVVFGLSLTASPSWRLMLGILSIPSLAYLTVCTMFLPESPRWLVSKGHMSAAKVVLQRLRGREDVEAEMALLVEGLEVRGETAFEEYILKPVETVISEEGKPTEPVEAKGNIVIFEPEYSQSWIATPLTVEREGDHRLLSRPGSIKGSSARLLDSTVALLDAIQSNLEDQQQHQDQWEQASEAKWDEESQAAERSPFVNGDRAYEHDEAEEEAEGLSTPLLEKDLSRTIEESTRAMNIPEEGYSPRHWRGSRKGSGNLFGSFRSSQGSLPGMIFGSTGNLGGGWQLAWKWEQGEGEDQEGHLKRVFLLQENPEQVGISVPAALHEVEGIPAAALVTEPAPYIAQVLEEEPLVGPATLHPAETDVPSLVWSELREVGVKRALVVGIGLQFFQQFSGINAVLYYLPQILEDAGAESVLSKLGLSSDSSSLLASGVITLLMLPCIVVAMRLMDRSGRRQLLLATLPVLAISLMVLVVTIVFIPAGVLQALLSFVSITVFACSFVTGLGPVPNIICSEIFPTRARGICIGLCSAVLWVSNVIVSDCFPLLLKRVGLAGAFSIFSIFTIISWIYVFLKVPETKGVPLEVISQIFAYQASAQATKKTL
ncbi:hypothetical protein KP509_01G019000 [Ceratopteris richardii]|uniref:Major facilitator superfamily (MFS) profile domain-containing protein n=1 Tax=Ceratopteris richardii TaxID=49495 RepID=A0A8T2VB03_CERRI|nr:hypothetical protein KP509_01G019000 [Ceratopteris richardii]